MRSHPAPSSRHRAIAQSRLRHGPRPERRRSRPDFYLFRYFTDDGNLNFVTGYKNQKSSDAIKAARATTDEAKRKELYTTAQTELVNGVPFLWLWVGREYIATLPTTKGYTQLATGSIIYLRQTWLDK